MMNRKIHVIQQLKLLPPSQGLSFKGKKAWIRCPLHGGGQERTPSLCINLDDGKFKAGAWSCFGCNGQADMPGGGTWNNLAEALNLEKIGRPQGEFHHRKAQFTQVEQPSETLPDDEYDDDIEAVAKEILPNPSLEEKSSTPQFLANLGDEGDDENLIDYSIVEDWPLWPANREWRTITGKTLRDIGARKAVDPYNRDRLWLPISVNGLLYSSIYCTYSKPKTGPSYIYDGSKDIRYAVFPFDYVKSMNKRYVVVVEGSRDALHLIDHGVPAVAILGGNTSWNNDKRDLILSLEPELIIAAPDPDEVGNKLAQSMREDFAPFFVPVKWFKMKSEVVDGKINKIEDPGNLSEERINGLKKRVAQFFVEKDSPKKKERVVKVSRFANCGDDDDE